MKQLWLAGAIAIMVASAGTASAGPSDGFTAAVAESGVPSAGFRFQQVRDWDHRRGWHGDRDWHDRVHTRIFLGFGNAWDPYWGPYWGPPSYYYNPPVIVTQPPPPTVYISPDQQSQPYYWYYCESSKRYYPYVKQCPEGWMKVVPHGPQQ